MQSDQVENAVGDDMDRTSPPKMFFGGSPADPVTGAS